MKCWSSRWFRVLALGLATALLVGCSGGKPTGTVKGKVSFNGNPIAEGEISLVSADRSTGGSAPLGTDGTFSFETPIPEGSYTVVVSPPKLQEAGDPSSTEAPKATVPMKYLSETTSDKVVEVKAGPNDLTIELTPGDATPANRVAP